jgi:lipopolysaccharide transport system permease protein
MAQLAEYVEQRELLVNLVLRELRSRYKKSVLGWTWSLLNPVASVVVYTVVFGVFLKIDPPVGNPSGLDSFVLFLLCALIPWNFFANSVSTSIEVLVGNANLIKKVYFPRELLVASTIGALGVTFLIELGVVCVVLLIVGNMVLPWIPVLLVLVAIEAVFVLGIGLVLGVTNVYFRDVRHFVGIALQILFYSTPIVYPLRVVPENSEILGVDVPVRDLYMLNPLVQLFEAFRDVLYDLRFPSLATMAYLIAWAGGMLAVGLWVFSKLDRRLAEEV